MLAEAVRFERTFPEGAVAFQATELPVAQRLRMEESTGIEPSSPGGAPVLKAGGGPSACTLQKCGGKGGSRTRTSRRTVPLRTGRR
jgi:hypothetical protein